MAGHQDHAAQPQLKSCFFNGTNGDLIRSAGGYAILLFHKIRDTSLPVLTGPLKCGVGSLSGNYITVTVFMKLVI